MARRSHGLILVILCLSFAGPALGSPYHYCRKYIEEAARKTGVLPDILWAVAKTESNYGKGPWPWTINVRGKGYYFPTRAAATKFLKSLPKKLRGNVDVGCMQLNGKYHGNAFSHLSQMLNPRLNVLYGAHFLKELYQRRGQWAKAVADYHNRKWRRGGWYANRVAHLVKDYTKDFATKPSASKPSPSSHPSGRGRR